MLLKAVQHENMCVEQNDALGKIEHAAITADSSHLFSISLLAQQHPGVKQPTCMSGFDTLEHINLENMDSY